MTMHLHRKPKRSIITTERAIRLCQQEGVYVVSCCLENCFCGKNRNYCERGFFSLFIQAVYGIEFAKRVNLPWFIDYGNGTYLYSDARRKENNFWNYYFEQSTNALFETGEVIRNTLFEVYPLRIWSKRHLKYLNQVAVKELRFKEDTRTFLQSSEKEFDGRKVLGVQIRLTDHAGEVLPVSLEAFTKEIDKRIKCFDKLFVATDDSSIIKSLLQRYGEENVIYNDVIRSDTDDAVHLNLAITDRYKLGLDVLSDCYCLTLCSHAILVHSNISYAALLFNPELPYTLLERPVVKLKRFKTLLLYYLDYFKIRRW